MAAASFIHALRTALGLLGRPARTVILACLLPIALLEMGVVVATRAAFAVLLGPSGHDGVFRQPGQLALVLLAVVVFMLVRFGGVTLLWAAIIRRVSAEQAALGDRLFASYLHMPFADLAGRDRMRLFHNLQATARSLLQDVLVPALHLISDGLVALALLAVLLVLLPGPTLVLMGWFLLVYGVLFRLVSRESRRLATLKWKGLKRLRSFDDWSLRHVRSVRLHAQEGRLEAHRARLGADVAQAQGRIFLTASMPRNLAELTLISALMLLFGWFAMTGHDPQVMLRDLSLLMVAGLRLVPAGQRAVAAAHQLQQGMPELRDILADLSRSGMALPAAPPIAGAPLFREEIALRDVSFAYAGGPPVLPRGTNLAVRRGEWVLLRGPSGTGKSTLLSLLLGFQPPGEGEVRIDGEAVAPLARFRGRKVALVAQDAGLLAGTIADNLAFPAPFGDAERARAATLMQALDLPFALESEVGDDGAKLSGGQRQRIALLRALMGRPDLLVLDEATAQLDPATEALVFDLIRSELPGATVIVAAHKLAADIRFDRMWAWQEDHWDDSGAADASPHRTRP